MAQIVMTALFFFISNKIVDPLEENIVISLTDFHATISRYQNGYYTQPN